MLTFHFTGKHGEMTVSEKLTAGAIGKHVRITFSPEWDGLGKTAVFMALGGNIGTTCAIDASGEVLVIPAEVLLHTKHRLYIQIQGFTDDGTVVINSDRIPGPEIEPGFDPEELPELDAQNPIWHDVLTQMGELDELETENRSTLVSAINELALRKPEPGASAYEIALENGFEGSESQWLESLGGKNAYEYAQDAGYTGTEEEFTAALLGNKDTLIIGLASEDDALFADKNYYEIAHARATDKLVLLSYGSFITHILAAEPEEGSFLFEPLLHSVPDMPSYKVDIQNNWTAVPVENNISQDIFAVLLEQSDDGEYRASATYLEIAQARATGKLVLLQYGVYLTHILAGEPTESSFLFEPLLHSVPDMPGYTVDTENRWSSIPLIGDMVRISDIADDLETNAGGQPLSAAQGVVLKGMCDTLKGSVEDLTRERNEILIYGYADDTALGLAVLSGRPVYCLYEHLYYLPLVSWDEATHTAVFGGCFENKTITCKAAAGEWSAEMTDVAKPEVFVGTEATTAGEFREAFASGKPCFLMKPNAGEGVILWVAYTCSSSGAGFYRVASDGTIQYGVLDSDGTFSCETAKIEQDIFVGNEATTTGEFHEAFSLGKACFLMRPWAGSGMTMWVAFTCGSHYTWFYRITHNGALQYGSLSSDGSFTYTTIEHTTAIGDSSTDTQIPTAKAVYAAVKEKLDTSALPSAIEDALSQAKASGEFNGAAGATPAQVIAAMSRETWVFTLEDGTTVEKAVPLL